MNKIFRVLGNSINYEQACEIRVPDGWGLVEFSDLQEVINHAEKYGIKRGEYYFFNQIEARNKKFKFSLLWLGRLDINSKVYGISRLLIYLIRARGVLIKKVRVRKNV